MKRSILLLAAVASGLATQPLAAERIDPGRISQALRAGKTVRVALANRDASGCIGVDNASTKPAARLMRFRCGLPTSYHPNNQYWILTPTRIEGEEEPYFTIVNWKSQKCMGVDKGSPLPSPAPTSSSSSATARPIRSGS